MNISFDSSPQDEVFLKILQKRVQNYFRENGLQKTGNKATILKAVFLFASYFLIYLSFFFSVNIAQYYLLNAILGMITIFLALNVAHDAAHNTFSASKTRNNKLLYTFDFLGASGYMWRLKHVYSHHPHVNIPNMDGDIKQSNLVRIFPDSKFLKLHRYQFLYMPILYLFYTLFWLMIRDFKDHFSPEISGKPEVKIPRSAFMKLFLGKLFFVSRMIILPLLLLSYGLNQILLGFVVFHFSASFTVALALISAHIGEDSIYPTPDVAGKLPYSWVRHQLMTTTDFATESPLVSHLFGGFNHHVIHHLFPKVCHIHYPELTRILKKTCEEYEMPYKSNKTLLQAVKSHLRFLKIRSKQEIAVEYIEM